MVTNHRRILTNGGRAYIKEAPVAYKLFHYMKIEQGTPFMKQVVELWLHPSVLQKHGPIEEQWNRVLIKALRCSTASPELMLRWE